MANRINLSLCISLFSVLIAVTALVYATWRNETTESQRSLRQAAFVTLERLTVFEGQVFILAYTKAHVRPTETPFLAWSTIRELRDLAQLLSPELASEANELFERWQQNFAVLDGWQVQDQSSRLQAQSAATDISDDIQALREGTIGLLKSLE